MAKIVTQDNVPNRFELFLLKDGEKKVIETADTRELDPLIPWATFKLLIKCTGIPSSSLFTFNKEDHTLGNLLRSRLLQSNHVTFAGYRVSHPLFR